MPPSKYLATLEKEVLPHRRPSTRNISRTIYKEQTCLYKKSDHTLEIEALSNDGNGVAHKDGQAVFVPLTRPRRRGPRCALSSR